MKLKSRITGKSVNPIFLFLPRLESCFAISSSSLCSKFCVWYYSAWNGRGRVIRLSGSRARRAIVISIRVVLSADNANEATTLTAVRSIIDDFAVSLSRHSTPFFLFFLFFFSRRILRNFFQRVQQFTKSRAKLFFCLFYFFFFLFFFTKRNETRNRSHAECSTFNRRVDTRNFCN